MSSKSIVSKHFVPSLDVQITKSLKFIVEAKLKIRFVKVGGPFSKQKDADDFAMDFSIKNPGIEVQVVAIQKS